MIKKIITGKLGRRKSPTIAPGTHCPIPKDVTFKSVRLAMAIERDQTVTIPGLGLKAEVRALHNEKNGSCSYELFVSGFTIRLFMQDCMTWGIPLVERYKLGLIKPEPIPIKPKSKL